MNLYQIKRDGWSGGWMVVRTVRYCDGRPVFYGTRRECAEWIERNGHDADV